MSESPYFFRESAVKSSLSSAEQLHQLNRIISPLAWLFLAGIYCILIAIIVWSIWGKVPTEVAGQGVLLVKKGSIYTASAPEGAGRVARIMVMPGDKILKGQVVAQLEQADLRKKVAVSEAHIEQLRDERAQLSSLSARMQEERRGLLTEQNVILNKSISIETKNLANLRELVELKQKSFAKGLETKEGVIASQTDLYRTEAAIEQYRDRLAQNAISEADFADRWQQRLQDLNQRIKEAAFQLNMLQEQLELANVVTSPAEGIVIGLQTSIGSIIKGGGPVVTIASLGEGMDAVAFIPAQDGKRVRPGMSALISPSNFKREEFGSIRGEVETVSQFPTTKEAMMAVLQNEHLVDFLAKQGPPITVRIRLIEDADTYSRFSWSSSRGPRQQVTPGSLADARITVREQSPISLIVPALRKITEG
jgi:HlyD family secretion protein